MEAYSYEDGVSESNLCHNDCVDTLKEVTLKDL
jgi:hypothetical protein